MQGLPKLRDRIAIAKEFAPVQACKVLVLNLGLQVFPFARLCGADILNRPVAASFRGSKFAESNRVYLWIALKLNFGLEGPGR
jgi:hypothetical protein